MKRGLPGLVALALAAGCSSGSGSEPKAITGEPRQVADAVAQLETATRRRDYETICGELFTRSARRRAGAGACTALLRSAAEGVRRPRIQLLSIHVRGDRAQARVRTRAAGQRSLEETIELEREDGRFRIESLRP